MAKKKKSKEIDLELELEEETSEDDSEENNNSQEDMGSYTYEERVDKNEELEKSVIRAFDKETGNKLWSHKLPYIGSAPPTSYEAKGDQYIIIPATGGLVLSFAYPELVKQGNAFVAFKLKK